MNHAPATEGQGGGARPSDVPGRPGFTLLQLLVALTIIAILVATMVPLTGALRRKADTAKCAANMRALAVALSAYTLENGHWPQPPMDKVGENEEKFWEWWMRVFERDPYDVRREMWICPTTMREYGFESEEDITIGTYVPTNFDASSPRQPYRWGAQPWLISACIHGHVLKPDGSVTQFGGKENDE